MNQKERTEAFRRGQHAGEEKTWTEEEWKARRALRRKRQRRRRRIRRVTTAVCVVAVAAAATVLVKALMQKDSGRDYIVISGDGVTSYFEGYATSESSQELTETAAETASAAATNAEATIAEANTALGSETAAETPAPTAPSTAAPTTPAPAQSAALSAQEKLDIASTAVIPSWIEQKFLEINAYSRVGEKLSDINDVVIHWVANPGSTAADNWEYFDSLAYPQANPNGTKASSQFIVGLDGEILQCMPLNEMAYAVKQKRNPDTISIEVCHPDWEGKFNDATYQSAVKLTAWLLEQFHLDHTHILRHYDITGKDCPKYYMENEDAWEQFKADVGDYMAANPNIQ